MNKPHILLSVTNDTNDYQVEQAKTARQAAARVGADLKIVYAQDDGVFQSQQLLQCIQSAKELAPDVIIFEPAGATTLPLVARAAAASGIGWVILSRDAEYITDLRSNFKRASVDSSLFGISCARLTIRQRKFGPCYGNFIRSS